MSSRCFIGKLPRSARQDDIKDLFRDFRDIREVTIKEGYGFIEFANEQDAKDAIRYFDGKDFLGERISVEIARPKMARAFNGNNNNGGGNGGGSRRGTGHSIIVENLPDMSWQTLKDQFRAIGPVHFADVDRNRHEGIVEFAHREDVDRAIRKMDRTKLFGETIRIRETRSRGGYSRSRSRSRDRRRSRDRDRRRSRSRDRGYDRYERDYDRGRRDDRDDRRRYSRSPSPGR